MRAVIIFAGWRGWLSNFLPGVARHRIGVAPPETFPNVKYDASEEVGGHRKCFDSVVKIFHVNNSRALSMCSLTVFYCP